MSWNLEEAIEYYKKQGAPGDQTALVGLLREIQQENGGRIPQRLLSAVAEGTGVVMNELDFLAKNKRA